MAETRALLDLMIEENREALIEARDKLDGLQMAKGDSNDREVNTTDQEGLDVIDLNYKLHSI